MSQLVSNARPPPARPANGGTRCDVLCNGVIVDRIFNAAVAQVGMPWMWTPIFGYHEDRTPTQGHAPTREAGDGSSTMPGSRSRRNKATRRPGRKILLSVD